MDSSSIKGVVNRAFLRRLDVASLTGRDEAPASSSSGGTLNVSRSLQSGQIAFTLAIQRLNKTGEFLNLSTDTLEKLLTLTDRAISLAEDAASTGSSDARRFALNKDFKEVAQEFRKTVRSAKLDGNNVLGKEELAAELEAAGLDRKASLGVADLYERLFANPQDDLFASEHTKGKRPISIPASAYIGSVVSGGGGAGETTYTYGTTKVSANDEQQGVNFGPPTMISANVVGTSPSYVASSETNSTSPTVTDSGYVTDNGYVAITENGGIYQIEGNNGGPFSGILTGAASIVAVNEKTGNFIIQSSEDFLSYNPYNVNQLFLADSGGNIIHQYTTFTSGDSITYGEVDLVDTDQASAAIIYSYQTAAGGTDLYIKTATILFSPGEDPATSTHVTIDSGASASLGNIDVAYGDVTINEVGTYIAYARYETSFNPGTQYSVQFLDTATLTANSFLATTEFASNDTLGFATTDSLFVLNEAGGGLRDVFAVNYVDGSFGTAILTNQDIGKFATGEERDGSGAGFFATVDANDDIKLYDNSGSELYSYNGTGTDAVQHLNIAAIDTSNQPKLGVFGITDLSGSQTDNELYAVTYDPGTQSKVGQTGVISKVANIHESDYTNPGEDHVLFVAPDGSSTGDPSLSEAYSLRGVNAESGVAVIATTANLLGFNASNYNQLYYVDAGGNITQQITNFSSMVEFGEVAIADTVQFFAYEVYDSGAGESTLVSAELALAGTGIDPATITTTNLNVDTGATGIGAFTSVAISSNGAYVAAVGVTGGTLYDFSTGTPDGFLADDSTVKAIGFIDNNVVAALRDPTIDGSSDTVSTFTAGGGSYTTVAVGLDVGLFTTLEKRSGSNGYFAFTQISAGDENDVVLADDTGTYLTTVNLDPTNDDVKRISLAYDSGNSAPEIGIYGTIASLDAVDQLYRVETSTDGLFGQSGLIASTENVYSSFDTLSPLTTSYVNTVGGGTVSGPTDPAAFPVLAVHESTGSYIIASTQDFLSFNSFNMNQLFLVDSSGTVLHQYTNNLSAGIDYRAVDFSGTRETIAYSVVSGGPISSVEKVDVGTLGEDPSSSTLTVVNGGMAGSIGQVKINDDGSHVAYSADGTGQIYFDTAGSPDGFLVAETDNLQFGFTDLTTLAIARNTDGDAPADEVVEYVLNSGTYSPARVSGVNIGAFTTEEKGSHADSFFAYSTLAGSLSQDVFVRYSSTGTLAGQFDGSGIDDISQVSLAYNPSEEIEVGLFGVVESIDGDTDAELYRLEVTASAPGGGGGSVYSSLPMIENDAEKIFSRSLLTRPEAYRVLHDLKALRQQISTNIETLKSTTKYVAENVTLARVAGTAFVEASQSSSSTSSPEAAVSRLRELLQQNGSGVLDQLENLDRVAVTALVRD